jgi:hypothetical protein
MQLKEFEDAKLLWKMYYAVQGFKHAQAAAEYILQKNILEDDPVFFPLMSAVYVLYGRPFKKTKGVGLLGNELVPQDHLKLHQSILDHRDQIYAHSDAKGLELANVGQANQVRAKRFPTETLLLRSQYQATPELLPQIIKLCQELQEKALAHVNQLFAQYAKHIPAKLGEYVLNIDDQEGDFFKPAKSVIEVKL